MREIRTARHGRLLSRTFRYATVLLYDFASGIGRSTLYPRRHGPQYVIWLWCTADYTQKSEIGRGENVETLTNDVIIHSYWHLHHPTDTVRACPAACWARATCAYHKFIRKLE